MGSYVTGSYVTGSYVTGSYVTGSHVTGSHGDPRAEGDAAHTGGSSGGPQDRWAMT
jgi:hypothetical protein